MPVYAWRDPLAFVEPMDWSVSNAMYWQPPHEEDVVAADPGVIAALRPVADAVAAAPAAAWWNTPVDLAALRYTSRFDAGHPPGPPTLTGARERLHRWRAGVLEEDHAAGTDRPADPTAPYSGCWWSTPAMASLVTTTRPLPGLGSIELAWEEDSFGQRSALIWPLTTTRVPRVWEVDRPAAWVRPRRPLPARGDTCAPTRLVQDHRPGWHVADTGLERGRRRLGRGARHRSRLPHHRDPRTTPQRRRLGDHPRRLEPGSDLVAHRHTRDNDAASRVVAQPTRPERTGFCLATRVPITDPRLLRNRLTRIEVDRDGRGVMRRVGADWGASG